MSVPEEKLNKILSGLDENDTSKVIEFAESLKKKQGEKLLKPSDFRGIWKNEDNIDIEEECRKLRDEWDRDIL